MPLFKKWFARRRGKDKPAGSRQVGDEWDDRDFSPEQEECDSDFGDNIYNLDSAFCAKVPESKKSRARAHHYQFAHVELRNMVFDDPVAYITLMCSSAGLAWLRQLWEDVGSQAVATEQGPKLSCHGLALSLHRINGTACPIVTMPKPEATVEVFFAAITAPQAEEDGYRYFVLEKVENSTDERPMGVFCEWFADGRRRNHERLIAADKILFEQAIAAQLRIEGMRRKAGVTPVAVRAWSPTDERITKEALLEAELDRRPQFRAQHCMFAFRVIPDVSGKDVRKWRRTIEEGQVDSFLLSFWEEAGRLCKEAGVATAMPPDGLSANIVAVNGQSHILIVMPEPIGAPEAYFLLISAGEDKPTVYTLEEPAIRYGCQAIVGRVDKGKHAVCAAASEMTSVCFVEAVGDLLGGHPGESPQYLLDHLSLYPKVYSVLRLKDPSAIHK